MRRALWLLPLTLICSAPRARAELVAERITEANVAAHQIGGPDAVGGIGDWYLANDLIEIIVDDPSRAPGKINHGGSIVDAGLRDRGGEDQFNQLFPILNLSQRVFVRYDEIRAEVSAREGWARLLVSSGQGPSSLRREGWLERLLDLPVPEPEALADVRIETEYRVRRGEPFVRIRTTIKNQGTRPAPVFAFGDVLMRGARGPRAFTGNTLAPERSRGFHHRSFDRGNLLKAGDAMAPFTFVSMPGQAPFPPIGYALFSPELARSGVPFFGVTDEQVTLLTVFLFEHGWQELSLMRMLRAMLHDLPPGAAWSYERRLLIRGSRSVSATTDVIFSALGRISRPGGLQGRVRPAAVPHELLVAEAETGTPVTSVHPRPDGPVPGGYGVTLPPGMYELSLRAPARPVETRQMELPEGRAPDALEQLLPPPGTLELLRLRSGPPMRVVVRGMDGTPDPVFDPDLTDFRLDGVHPPGARERSTLLFPGAGHGPETVELPPGHYRLIASHGLEYDVDSALVEIRGPGTRTAAPALQPHRVIELPGLLSADFHVHAEASDDTNLPNTLRLDAAVADGLDVMTATDHDHLASYGPALQNHPAATRLHVMLGVEVTSAAPSPVAPYTIGHTNAWPLHHDPSAHRQGAPPTQNQSLADLYTRLRTEYGAEIIQMNHPRSRGVGQAGYLNHLGDMGRPFDPERPISEAPNKRLLEPGSDGHTRAIDFDTLELMNGSLLSDFLWVRRDLYALLRQGFRRTGTAVSDSHDADGPALPRSYVLYSQRGSSFDVHAFNRAVREGRLFCTTGPLFTRFEVNGGAMGDLIPAPGGQVRVRLRVEAAPWVPVKEVRVLVNGKVVQRYVDLPGLDSQPVLRKEAEIQLRLERDGFVTLEAGTPLPDELDAAYPPVSGTYAEIAPGLVPLAFANPVFVDVDGNGRFDPPGL